MGDAYHERKLNPRNMSAAQRLEAAIEGKERYIE